MMNDIAFLLNGTPVRVSGDDPTRTLLQWLREDRGLTGTKEGCNEGDCGACTVMVTDAGGTRALNACILFLPQLHGRAVRTVEGLSGPKGEMHPVQAAMVDHHDIHHTSMRGGYYASITPLYDWLLRTNHERAGRTTEAAGDAYETRASLAINGLGTVAAALFGSCFPTTIYIGHPGWKAMGARAGYSVLNAGFIAIICLTGTLAYIAWAVPIDAGMAIVLWIGIVITAQAFDSTPRHHSVAVVVGLLPGVGAWGALMAKAGLRAAGLGSDPQHVFSPALIDAFKAGDVWIHGAFALEQGFIFTAMILSAATVELIERRFTRAAIWCWAGAALSAVGLMHSYRFTPGDTVVDLSPAWPWAAGYAAMGALFFLTRFVTEPSDGH